MITEKAKRDMIRRAELVNKEITLDILASLPEGKKQTLEKALDRNLCLTSSRNLEDGTLKIYKEGFYVRLEGTRCSFSAFAYDRDGKFEIAARKPRDGKLSFLYEQHLKFSEDDFREIAE